MLRNWITVLLLCSFLRLQFVCCCGAVGHYDSTNEPISDVQTDKQHLKTSCSNSHHKARIVQSKAKAKVDTCCCRHSKGNSSRKQVAVTKDVEIPLAVCGGKPSNEDTHHHLYWLTHGNVLPSEKASLKEDVDAIPVSFGSWFGTPTFSEQWGDSAHRVPLNSDINLLTQLGHWRI